MRFTTSVVVLLLALASWQSAFAQDSPPVPDNDGYSIKIGCREVEGNKSARNTTVKDPMTIVGVRHGLPFELLVLCGEIPEEKIAGCWVALSDSGLNQLEHKSLVRRSDYYVPVYGLAVVKLADGSCLTCPFFISTSWKPEERDEIPDEHPLPVFPETDDPLLRPLLVDWWNTIVLEEAKANWSESFTLDPVK